MSEPDISSIPDPAELEGVDPGVVMDRTHHAGRVPDLPWTMPGSGSIGDGSIVGDTNEGDVELLRILNDEGPHEGGDLHEAGGVNGIEGVWSWGHVGRKAFVVNVLFL